MTRVDGDRAVYAGALQGQKGYLVARPMPAEAIAAWWEQWQCKGSAKRWPTSTAVT